MSEWKTLFEIFRFRRDDNIKTDPKERWRIGVKHIQLIHYRIQWQFLVNTAISSGYIKGKKFVGHSKEATFLRNILLSEFSWNNGCLNCINLTIYTDMTIDYFTRIFWASYL
jgi:hypothetical protein